MKFHINWWICVSDIGCLYLIEGEESLMSNRHLKSSTEVLKSSWYTFGTKAAWDKVMLEHLCLNYWLASSNLN
jgi:hypothetical protein